MKVTVTLKSKDHPEAAKLVVVIDAKNVDAAENEAARLYPQYKVLCLSRGSK